MAYNITFSPDAWADYLYWQTVDKKTLKRIKQAAPGVAAGWSGAGPGQSGAAASCRGHE